jgi:hypothetical protein
MVGAAEPSGRLNALRLFPVDHHMRAMVISAIQY